MKNSTPLEEGIVDQFFFNKTTPQKEMVKHSTLLLTIRDYVFKCLLSVDYK